MTDQFNKGKITESHYEILDNKISEYIEKLEAPDVPSSTKTLLSFITIDINRAKIFS
ncbi:MAG TPA: hypothetical protein VJ799_13400 [Nitrososphaeraceae archaeon]|nr:hypothetical protein [Nitrososphaeraceae archaeon]